MNTLSLVLLALATLHFFPQVQAAFDHPERTLEVLRGVVRNQESAVWLKFNFTCPRTHFCFMAYITDIDWLFYTHNDFRFIPLTCSPTDSLLHEEFVLFYGVLLEIGDYDPHVEIFEDCSGPGELRRHRITLPGLGQGGAVHSHDIQKELGKCNDPRCLFPYDQENGRFARWNSQFMEHQKKQDSKDFLSRTNMTDRTHLFEKRCTELRRDGEDTHSLHPIPCTSEPVTLPTLPSAEIARVLPTDPVPTQNVDEPSDISFLLSLSNSTSEETDQIDADISNSTTQSVANITNF